MSSEKINSESISRIDEYVGAQVRRIRESRGVKAFELRDLLGYKGASSITHLETGRYTWKLEHIYKVAEFLEVPVSDLLPGLAPMKASGAVSVRGLTTVRVSGVDKVLKEREAAIASAYTFGGYEAAAFTLSILLNVRELVGRTIPDEADEIIEAVRSKGLAAATLWVTSRLLKRGGRE